jgi:prephenate dehydratase/chorismate mutase
LEELRQSILALDAELVALLNRRASLSLAVGERKRADGQSEIFHPHREAALMKQLEGLSPGPLPKEHLRTIYREILSSSRCLQRPQQIAFPGPEESSSHIAGRELLGSLAGFQPKSSLAAVFTAVSDRTCDIGIVPLENSLQEGIEQSFELFLRHPDLYIQGETEYRATRFVLIGRTPTDRPGTGKSSLLFAVPGKPDNLSALLRIFASHAISLRKLASRPMPGEPDNSLFFADFECDMQADEYTAALDAVREHCLFLRVLGNYPSRPY